MTSHVSRVPSLRIKYLDRITYIFLLFDSVQIDCHAERSRSIVCMQLILSNYLHHQTGRDLFQFQCNGVIREM